MTKSSKLQNVPPSRRCLCLLFNHTEMLSTENDWMCSLLTRSIPAVEMSAPVFPESPNFVPNSLSSKITMENQNQQVENKEEGEKALK